MKILVTGGTGHVGAAVIKELVKRNVEDRRLFFTGDLPHAVKRSAVSIPSSASAAAPGAAQDRMVQTNPMEVTSDTPEYCLHLLDRVSDLVRVSTAPVPREVTDLTTEGQRMCAKGQTRMGIMRLRSALMQMEKVDGAAYR